MRKIVSKEAEEKKRRRNQFFIGGILAIVMLLSTIGYSLNGSEKTSTTRVIYKDVEFNLASGFWNANIGNYLFSFKFNPNEAEKINSDFNSLNSYSEKPLYIYSENSEAEQEIYNNLFYQNQIVQRVQYACPENEKCLGDYPVKTCTDNFIIIRESSVSEVNQQDNCVFISGSKENLAKLSDGFLLKIIGVQ
jgi:hypothetical protein